MSKQAVLIAGLVVCLLTSSYTMIACSSSSNETEENPISTQPQTVEQNTLPCIADVVAMVKAGPAVMGGQP